MATRTKKVVTLVPADCMPLCQHCNAYVKSKDHDQGSCRANPPQLIVFNDELGAEFPIVFPDEWCRLFVRRVN